MPAQKRISRKQVRQLISKGFSDYEISKFIHCQRETIFRIRHELKLSTKNTSILPKVITLSNQGLQDKELSNKLNLSLKELSFFKSLLYRKTCKDCNSSFLTNSKLRLSCYNCRDTHIGEYYGIRYLRDGFYKLSQTSPQAALEIHKEMLETEGKEFTELVLDGIPKKLNLEETSILEQFGYFMNTIDYEIDRSQELILSKERKDNINIDNSELNPYRRNLRTIESLRQIALRKILKQHNIEKSVVDSIIERFKQEVQLKKKTYLVTPLERSYIRSEHRDEYCKLLRDGYTSKEAAIKLKQKYLVKKQ